ncbi:MAG TPA: cytochrome c [Candidatus Aquilonibacter sp.]|nr:cytochrome c [Candidatus Aquilonibacter sp.]
MRMYGIPLKQSMGSRQMLGRLLLCASGACFIAACPGPGARAASRADRAAGAVIFKQHGCEHCHGPDGAGTERGPSLTTVGKRLKKDQIELQIREGGKQMPPFGDVLNDDEMRELVDYLAHKKKAPRTLPGS